MLFGQDLIALQALGELEGAGSELKNVSLERFAQRLIACAIQVDQSQEVLGFKFRQPQELCR